MNRRELMKLGLFSSAALSLAGWAAKQPMKRYFNVGGATG